MTNPNIEKFLPKMEFAPPPTSTSREMRNRAEKQRRDKLNTYIAELAQINPFISGSDKKMDKTSVLRLSAAWMRYQKYCDALDTNKPQASSVFENNNSISNVNNNSRSLDAASSSRIFYTGDLPIPENLTEHMLEDMNCFLLLVSSTGKIVFVSSSVVKLLGHSQNDLMGQSIFNITCPNDQDTLRKNLQMDDDDEPGPSTRPEPMRQRKNFFVKLSQKSSGRSDSAQYEIFQIIGNLVVLNSVSGSTNTDTHSTQICRKTVGASRACKDGGQQQSGQSDLVLMAIVKSANLHSSDLVRMDANKEEYFTRHSLEGEIIYCDQRISVTAGYMVEEVFGVSAFRYMHHDDVNWCIVSLKQMYSKGGGFGYSTYRLQAKTGNFIFLRTHGYLEYDKESNKPVSFICINTLLSEEEGWRGLKEMKQRFSAKVKNQGAIMPASEDEENIKKENDTTLDDDKIDMLVENHLSNVSPLIKLSLDDVPDPEYVKCVVASKQLPPPSVSIKSALASKRRDSVPGRSPQHSVASPRSPAKELPPSPVALPPPPPPQTLSLQADVFQTAKGTCPKRPKVPGRRGRPRGSGGIKRRAAQVESTSTKRMTLESTFESFDSETALQMGLWDVDTSPLLSSTADFLDPLPLYDDSTDLSLLSELQDDLLLPISPSQPDIRHHHPASKVISRDSLDEAGVLNHLKTDVV
ncbi:circadian locomoter output cycles protein kaput-like isoform X2 [Neocloeon triangulifer]|uniref:circadian locomoter output cycles protein kaput-like isoform X2 n=1 Tax=Neocloeon triangulifer TaxID=2078957 RepID=UPI00286F58CC|nr:circadian locomoter output cycles protein kaput-like isoform X2 [Neocloeon triangulifer]